MKSFGFAVFVIKLKAQWKCFTKESNNVKYTNSEYENSLYVDFLKARRLQRNVVAWFMVILRKGAGNFCSVPNLKFLKCSFHIILFVSNKDLLSFCNLHKV